MERIETHRLAEENAVGFLVHAAAREEEIQARSDQVPIDVGF